MAKASKVDAVQQWPASKVYIWPISKIVPYERNPRQHPQDQIDLLAESMKSDGVTAPILVDEKGIILAGHGRLAAAKQNGFEKYPVVIAEGWSEQKKAAVRLKDNQIALLSTYDNDLLRLELTDLKLHGYDLKELGFTDVQLVSFLAAPRPDNDPEDVPEEPADPISRSGDIWRLGNHRLMCGDSTSADDVAALLGDRVPNLMVTDPPYGVDYDANWRNEAAAKGQLGYGARAVTVVQNDNRADWSAAWKLFPGNVAYCWHSDRFSFEVQQSLREAGFEIVNQIIWAKSRFVISRGDYHSQHEAAIYCVRKGRKHGWRGDRSQTTLWTIDHQKSETGHSTQKPVECMRRPIQNNSRAGDWVYEPFSGSGTTIIAAEMENRNCLAMEIWPGFVDIAVQRWQGFTEDEAVLESTGQSYAEVAGTRTGTRQKRRVSQKAKRPAKK